MPLYKVAPGVDFVDVKGDIKTPDSKPFSLCPGQAELLVRGQMLIECDADVFTIPAAAKESSTKFNLDDPGFTNAYAAVIGSPWTAEALASALNASAAGAPAPYTTTVWDFDEAACAVFVVSGPVPTTLDLLSAGYSIPLGGEGASLRKAVALSDKEAAELNKSVEAAKAKTAAAK